MLTECCIPYYLNFL